MTSPHTYKSTEERLKSFEALLGGDLHTPQLRTQILAVCREQLHTSQQRFIDQWLPILDEATPHHGEPWLISTPTLLELMQTHTPDIPVKRSLTGLLILYLETFATRTDLKTHLHIDYQPCAKPTLPPDLPEQVWHFASVIKSINFKWKFKNLTKKAAYILDTSIPMHGGIHLNFTTASWQPEPEWNTWKVLDYHARESLRLGDFNKHAAEYYLIADGDKPRQDAYIAMSTSVDGGNYGGTPACKTQTRYRNLESFLTLGAQHAFHQNWDMITPRDQDFGSFNEVERQLFIPEYFEDDSSPEADDLDELLCAHTHSTEEATRKLQHKGIPQDAIQELLHWLEQGIKTLA